jgi:phage tail sheath protein FI
MASTYLTPGVYIEEIAKLPPSIAPVATAIPAFIGYTEKALSGANASLTNKPTRITSLIEYETYFGKAQPEDNLAVTLVQTTSSGTVVSETISAAFGGASSKHNTYYAMEAYFANGGGPCYVVSIGPYKALGTDLAKAEFELGLAAAAKEDEPTLLVFPEGQSLPEKDHYSLLVDALVQCGKLQNRFALMDMHHTGDGLLTSGDVQTAANATRTGISPTDTTFLKYGALYFPDIRTDFPYRYNESQVAVTHTLDGAPGPQNGHKLADLNNSASAAFSTALYNKLKRVVDNFDVTLPPSPVMAGVYASVDSARGVWKAPANVALADAIDLTCKVTNDIQDLLNVDPTTGKSVNCIRAFTGKGIVVWGARTLAGNDNEWRYINVRRFCTFAEMSCKLATAAFVFEPNDANTWVKVQSMIENFLTTLWRQGALQGAKPEHAFYVAVGLGKTMSSLDILEGRMIVEIGLAVVRPAEFIILRFSQMLATT